MTDDKPKTQLLTLDDLDRRTRAGQRAFEFADRLISERGGAQSMGILRATMVKSVAVLSAMIEHAQACWLAGDPVNLNELATLLNARRREAEKIGLDPDPKDITPSLEAILRDFDTGDK